MTESSDSQNSRAWNLGRPKKRTGKPASEPNHAIHVSKLVDVGTA